MIGELEALLADYPRPEPPEEVAPGLWRARVADSLWQWCGAVGGLSLVATTSTPDAFSAVRMFRPTPGRVGVELLDQEGNQAWSRVWVEPAGRGVPSMG